MATTEATIGAVHTYIMLSSARVICFTTVYMNPLLIYSHLSPGSSQWLERLTVVQKDAGSILVWGSEIDQDQAAIYLQH